MRNLRSVTYIDRKPPQSWKGSPAETRLDLDDLGVTAQVHFEGSARDAATEYPKNTNVAAGSFGQFSFEIRGQALPDNPRSSALAAMSVISKLEQRTQSICF